MAEEKDAKIKEQQTNKQAATPYHRVPSSTRPGIDQETTSTAPPPPRNGLLKIRGKYTTFGSK